MSNVLARHATGCRLPGDPIADRVLMIIRDGAVVPEGTHVSANVASGDAVDLTGSGQAEPGEDEEQANGGGTFVHKNSAADTLAEGVYFVTGSTASWTAVAA